MAATPTLRSLRPSPKRCPRRPFRPFRLGPKPARPDRRARRRLKSFDLEKFIGVRGAAWLGGIALAIAGTLFAKYSIENNLIPPALRIAFLIVLGLVSLVGSEVFFRPRYPATASPVCGAASRFSTPRSTPGTRPMTCSACR